jgi:CHAT domain-containing protein/tetratricopeptide (TPR) repeat protein
VADLEEAIRVSHQAVQATPPDSPALPGYLTNLGIVLNDRFLCTGQTANLEEAIRVSHQAVQVTPPDSPSLRLYLNNLGIVLHDRYRFRLKADSEAKADLDEAIRHWEQAVQVTPPDAPDLSNLLNNLGTGLIDRFRDTPQAADLDEAIQVWGQAIHAAPANAREQATYLSNLGTGLWKRFERMGQTADLEEAIRVSYQAVRATLPDSPHLPRHLSNLGHCLRGRFERTGQVGDLEEAIRVFRRACEGGTDSAPQIALLAAANWGGWAIKRHAWGEAADAYGYGLTAGRQLLTRQLERRHKEGWLRFEPMMAAPAAYALAKLGRVEEAAATMERGRARLLADAVERNRRDLEQLPARGHEALYRRYRESVETQEPLTRPSADPRNQAGDLGGQARLDAIAAAARAFDQVVADIRQVPGYADFLAEPTFAHVQAAANDAPVVYLLATAAGGLALILYHGKVHTVWLDTLVDVTVREWLMGGADDSTVGGWLDTYRKSLIERTEQAQRAWFAAIDDVTHRLWSHVMGPLSAALHERLPVGPSAVPAVTLIPAHFLALLPLHAAWTEDMSTPTGRRYFMDEFSVRYAPSALSLRHARDVAERVPAARLLAVQEPLAAGATPLPNVRAEVAAIAGLFKMPVILAGAKATRDAVRAALPQADVVHFSCHGHNNWRSPLESGLLMADDQAGANVLLTLQDLLDLEEAGGRLATLSACETGILGIDLPDEVVSLPSALMQVGFGGVVASLWSVADISTAMLMEHFYRGWRAEQLPPAQALRTAQRWVRDTTNREKADYFRRYSAPLSNTAMYKGTAAAFLTEGMSGDPDRQIFVHPFWWAAFYLTGV